MEWNGSPKEKQKNKKQWATVRGKRRDPNSDQQTTIPILPVFDQQKSHTATRTKPRTAPLFLDLLQHVVNTHIRIYMVLPCTLQNNHCGGTSSHQQCAAQTPRFALLAGTTGRTKAQNKKQYPYLFPIIGTVFSTEEPSGLVR